MENDIKQSIMGLNPGYKLRDRYEIIQQLARGGWGITYLAKDIGLPNKPHCVIKEITPSPYLSESQNETLFEREANALYRLGKHPQIPHLFARFKQDNKFYLIQEYISGATLEQELEARKNFTEAEVINLLRKILVILQEVHRQEYIHRDLKPSNLICREKDDKIVLIDFGTVKELYSTKCTDSGEFKTTVVIGTHGYMPAEQIAKNPQYNSDLYGLGITAIRLLTGLYPPSNLEINSDYNNKMQIDSATGEVIWNNTPPLSKKLTIKPELEAILNKMVRYNFCDRYQNVEEVLKDLEELTPATKILVPIPIAQKRPSIKLLASGLCGLVAGIVLTKIIPLIMAPKTQDYPIDFAEVCNDPLIKGQEFQNYQGSPEFIVLKSSVPIWSVFGWKCAFSYQGNMQIKGLELDDYCLEKYRDTGYQYQAYFKNYLDKHSWYCTNVGTKFNPFLAKLNDSITSGEETINSDLPLQKQAAKLFYEQNYIEAVVKLQKSWDKESKDPKTLIYLNNALLELAQKEYYTIAITVPLTSNVLEDSGVKNIDLANEMLRGVAQAQTEVNLGLDINNQLPGKQYLLGKSINGKGLKVVIADDRNEPQQARKIASKLIAQIEILGVIGNYASDLTAATIDIFNNNQTTLISPGSTSEELTQPHRPFFFRTVPTVTDTGEELANYLINTSKLKKAAIFYNPESPYTRSIRKEFKQVFEAKGGKVVLEYDNFHQTNFDAEQALAAIGKQEDIAIVLFPDGQVTAAVNNSLKIIKLNNDHNWVVGGATLYNLKTLEIGRIQTLEKFVIAVPWHRLSSPNLEFTNHSEKLWGGKVNHRTALAYDAARTLIHGLTIQAKKSEPITRVSIQKTIANSNFSTQGAIGTIRFTPNGNRRNPFVELVKIIQCDRPDGKMQFVPLSMRDCW
ncbi:MAG: bifunctional serine/threonine-protein kinase/ABC transporter substrate-binding protein [Xenococcaceae cyanobacterium MO_207.B15]|nr:bifunctional serine/threonine-protein kinase/ABC transporter substrate-binding protein [Xenococcaceae cyanobacterium MO_207.B15]